MFFLHSHIKTKELMKTKNFNLIILDESGSMIAMKKEAIDSVNETVGTIRLDTQENEHQL